MSSCQFFIHSTQLGLVQWSLNEFWFMLSGHGNWVFLKKLKIYLYWGIYSSRREDYLPYQYMLLKNSLLSARKTTFRKGPIWLSVKSWLILDLCPLLDPATSVILRYQDNVFSVSFSHWTSPCKFFGKILEVVCHCLLPGTRKGDWLLITQLLLCPSWD